MVFGWGKGGISTKSHFSIMAPGIDAFAHNIKIFATYEAADIFNNTRKVLHPFLAPSKICNNQSFAWHVIK